MCAHPPRAPTFVRRSLNPARARQGSIMMVPITIVLSAVYFSIDELGIQVRRAAARARLRPCRGSDGSGRRLTRARRGLFVRRLRSRTACCQSRGSVTRSRAACARCSPTTCRPRPLPRAPVSRAPSAPSCQHGRGGGGRRSRGRSAESAQTWRRGTERRKTSSPPPPPLPRAPVDMSERCAFDVSVRRVPTLAAGHVTLLYEGRRATRAAAMRCGVLLRVAGRVRGCAGAPVACSTHRASNALLVTLKRRHAPAANVSVARASSAKPPPPPPPPLRTSPRSARNTATSAASAAVCLPGPRATSAELPYTSTQGVLRGTAQSGGISSRRAKQQRRSAAGSQRARRGTADTCGALPPLPACPPRRTWPQEAAASAPAHPAHDRAGFRFREGSEAGEVAQMIGRRARFAVGL
jgi:hypothetical protein